MKFDPEKHQRRSVRFKGYDYSAAGGYYVTVVTLWRECLFGEVADGEVRLNTFGQIVREEWFKTAALRSYVQLYEDEFLVMPNHVHGIIWIIDDTVGARRSIVGAQRRCAPTKNVAPRSLGAIVRAFKSAVTYRAGRELQCTNIWQRNYHEHVLRDQADYERIANYIASNPVNWEEDEENPGNLSTG